MGIYIILNKVNLKIYVGQTVQKFKNRWFYHRSTLRRKAHKNNHLQNAWDLYGEKNFIFLSIEQIENEKLLGEREEFWSGFYDSINSEKGYNLQKPLKNNSYRHSEEHKKKISQLQKGKKKHSEWTLKTYYIGKNNPFYGKKHSQISRDKMSNSECFFLPFCN